MNPHSRRSGQSGMTLLELLVTLGISAIVAVALTTILFSSTRLGSRTSRRADFQGGARQALSMMTTEIRQAGADPRTPPIGVVGIVAADSVTLHVRADLDGDGVIRTAEPSEDVTYAWSSTSRELSRDPGTGATPVLSNVSAFELAYFDETGTRITLLPLSTADAARVRSIRLSLTATGGDAAPISVSTLVTLRNR
jgi:type IV pilus assembly protein PilW